MKQFYFLSLGSGSCGNCYYLGTKDYGFLIDGGVPPRRIKRELKKYELSFENIKGVFVTHDHTDHVRYTGALNMKYEIPLYTTKRIFHGILRNRYMTQMPRVCNFIKKNETFKIKDFTIQSFTVPHDAAECLAYVFCFGGKKLTLATDLGAINENLTQHARTSNFLVIEANYDDELLNTGRYPAYLKERVRSTHGHLSNSCTAKFLAENWHENLQYVFLCHLSAENNTPHLAYHAVANELKNKNITPHYLAPLNRESPSELFTL